MLHQAGTVPVAVFDEVLCFAYVHDYEAALVAMRATNR